MEARRYNPEYAADMVRYLDKYFIRISTPSDIMRIFAKVARGQRNLWLGFRAVFNFLEATGYDTNVLSVYRKALPKVSCGIDLKVPEEPTIIKAFRSMQKVAPKYIALFDLLVDSGLRLVEAVKVLTELESAEHLNGFYRVALGEFRGSKQAYYAYITEYTYAKLLAVKGEALNARQASHYYRKLSVLRPKYARKFAFDKMVELEVPESVADFIEGRVPKRIGAKHYMVLRRQADKFYGKYAEYLIRLRTSLQ